MLRTIVDLLKILFCFEDPLYVVKIDGHYWRYNPEMPKSVLSFLGKFSICYGFSAAFLHVYASGFACIYIEEWN